jgi:hypothetical protein
VFEKSSDSLPSRRRLPPPCQRFADSGVERKLPARSVRVGVKPPMGVIVNRRLGVTHCLLNDLKNIRVRGPSGRGEVFRPSLEPRGASAVH